MQCSLLGAFICCIIGWNYQRPLAPRCRTILRMARSQLSLERTAFISSRHMYYDSTALNLQTVHHQWRGVKHQSCGGLAKCSNRLTCISFSRSLQCAVILVITQYRTSIFLAIQRSQASAIVSMPPDYFQSFQTRN